MPRDYSYLGKPGSRVQANSFDPTPGFEYKPEIINAQVPLPGNSLSAEYTGQDPAPRPPAPGLMDQLAEYDPRNYMNRMLNKVPERSPLGRGISGARGLASEGLDALMNNPLANPFSIPEKFAQWATTDPGAAIEPQKVNPPVDSKGGGFQVPDVTGALGMGGDQPPIPMRSGGGSAPPMDPRDSQLKAEGFKNYGPGVYGRVDNPVGPPRTISAFGRNIQVPVNGGTASMMQASGTPTAERLESEKLGRDLSMETGKQQLAYARLSPEEKARISAKPDMKMDAFKSGMMLEQKIFEEGDRAEAEFRAEWARRSPNTQPPQEAINEARKRAAEKYQGFREFNKSAVTQDRPGMGEGFAAGQ